MNRRDFLHVGSAAAAGLLLAPTGLRGVGPLLPAASVGDALHRELAARGLDSARAAGAAYADIRFNTVRTRSVAARERRVTGVQDNESYGFGVRVLVGGTWGFAASDRVSSDEVEVTARRAVQQARANRVAQRRPVELAPLDWTGEGEWRSPIRVDPFTIPVEEMVALLFETNAAALSVRGARFCTSSLSFVKEEKFFASSEGIITDQTVHRCWPQVSVTAVSSDGGDFQSRNSTSMQPMGLGYEYVLDQDLPQQAPTWAEDAVSMLEARPVEPGRYDLILLPSHLFLTIHESVAHPTELDRIFGFEANYAGTSFIHPVEEYLGRFRYGPEFVQFQGERSAPGGLATVGWDDEGVRPRDYLIVRDGVLDDLQTTREQALWLDDWYTSRGREPRSHGNSYAQSWADVQFQRMPNVNLLPNPERDVSFEELLDGVERGIVIEGRGSYSIDQQRYNAQFGGQLCLEVRNGRVVGPVKDAAYQIRTPEFWNSLDLLGGESTYELGGTFNDGKGQPSQSNAVSHGCPAARFRDVTVINTGRVS